MVDTKKHSSFPPLLGQYNTETKSKLEYTPRSYPATADIRSDLQRQQQVTNPIVSKPKTHRIQEPFCPRARRMKSTSNKKFEGKANLKQTEKQEAILKAWNGFVSEEKKQRYHILQERVKTQRILISKNDELSNNFKVKAEEERLEKLQHRRMGQKEVMVALKAHIQRVEVHKEMVSKKVQQISLPDDTLTPISSEPTKTQSLTDSSSAQQEIADSKTVFPAQIKNTREPVMEPVQVRRYNNVDIMWQAWKRNATRKLTPIIRQAVQLKQIASPSVQQYLQMYERPTLHNRDTGKSTSLSDVLGQASTSSGQKQFTRNNALGTINRLMQQKAEIMLDAKKTFGFIDKYSDPRNYLQEGVQNIEEPEFSPRFKSTQSTHGKSIPVLQPKQYETTLAVKKQLPLYLTPSGNVCSGSLVGVGDILYCTPSRTKDVQKTFKHGHSKDSIVLTDSQRHAATSYSPLSKGNKGNDRHSPKKDENGTIIHRGKNEFEMRHVWHPLSSSALSEYHNVTELPVSGLGHGTHGRYRMWKPSACIVNLTDAA